MQITVQPQALSAAAGGIAPIAGDLSQVAAGLGSNLDGAASGLPELGAAIGHFAAVWTGCLRQAGADVTTLAYNTQAAAGIYAQVDAQVAASYTTVNGHRVPMA